MLTLRTPKKHTQRMSHSAPSTSMLSKTITKKMSCTQQKMASICISTLSLRRCTVAAKQGAGAFNTMKKWHWSHHLGSAEQGMRPLAKTCGNGP